MRSGVGCYRWWPAGAFAPSTCLLPTTPRWWPAGAMPPMTTSSSQTMTPQLPTPQLPTPQLPTPPTPPSRTPQLSPQPTRTPPTANTTVAASTDQDTVANTTEKNTDTPELAISGHCTGSTSCPHPLGDRALLVMPSVAGGVVIAGGIAAKQDSPEAGRWKLAEETVVAAKCAYCVEQLTHSCFCEVAFCRSCFPKSDLTVQESFCCPNSRHDGSNADSDPNSRHVVICFPNSRLDSSNADRDPISRLEGSSVDCEEDRQKSFCFPNSRAVRPPVL
jgi:hypothetical protein